MERKNLSKISSRQIRTKLAANVKVALSSFDESGEILPSIPVNNSNCDEPKEASSGAASSLPGSSSSVDSEDFTFPRSPDCSSSSESDQEELNLVQDLVEWSLENNVSQTAVSQLLKVLKKHPCFASLPLDSRTLLKTPRQTQIVDVSPGQYVHFGLVDGLIRSLQNSSSNFGSVIQLQVGIDGIPISQSSGKQLWPILGYVCDSGTAPFEIGIYCGKQKPGSLNDYLRLFVRDLKQVLLQGITYKNHQIQVIFNAFIADAPARAFLKCVKCHGGYSACEKCTIYGEYIERRVVYIQEGQSVPRTDASFRAKLDDDHHLGETPLTELPIDLITSFPFEYMHLICLGVVRKLICLWLKGNVAKFRLGGKEVNEISFRLYKIQSYVPSDFNRKPRPISEFNRWKASELRQFLLYTGPTVLKGILPDPN